MDIVIDAFWAIKNRPMDYLPERTIFALWHFLNGYSWRIYMEGMDSGMRYLYPNFQRWLEDRYKLRPTSNSVFSIVDSISDGPESALDNFYKLFEEFQNENGLSQLSIPQDVTKIQRMDICELLRMIRKKPAMYIGYPHFSGLNAYLAGHIRAGNDLGFQKTPDEMLFETFTQWIENNWSSGTDQRPWFKKIRFVSSHDFGFSPAGTFSIFYELLDEYAIKIGKQRIFAEG